MRSFRPLLLSALPLASIHCGSTADSAFTSGDAATHADATAASFPDGSTPVTLPDGAMGVMLPDGATVVPLPDGATVIPLPDGGVVVVNPPPDAMVTTPDDGGISTRPDSGNPVSTDGGPVVTGPDASTTGPFVGSLVGTWRVVRYRVTDGGNTYDLTDRNSHQRFGPVTVDLRTNGLFFIRNDRYSLSFAVLLNDHAYVREDPTMLPDVLSLYGLGAPITLSNDALVDADGARTQLTRNADGTISLTDETTGGVYTFAHTDGLRAGPATYTARGTAVWFGDMHHTAFAGHARFAIAWDRPGSAGGVTYANDAPITFDTFDNAAYDVAVSAPPTDAIGTVGASRVAAGYPVAYDDVDGDNHYDPAHDTLRGRSTFAIAWRDGALNAADLLETPYRDVPPGFSLADVHGDFSILREALTPLDPSTTAGPDVALASTGTAPSTFPDIVR